MVAKSEAMKPFQLKTQLLAELKSANNTGPRQKISSSLPSNKQYQIDKAVYLAPKQGSF